MTEYMLEQHRKYPAQLFRPLEPRPTKVDMLGEAWPLQHGRYILDNWIFPVKSRTKPLDSLLFERRLQEETARAQDAILGLQDNWDGQGSPGYARSTMNSAIRFLNIHVNQVFKDSGRTLIPKVLPSDGGSIDLHWKERKFELLVNIPATDDVAVSFYAENLSDRSSIKGTFDRSSASKVLIYWLTEASE